MKKLILSSFFTLSLSLGYSQFVKSLAVKSGLALATQDWQYKQLSVVRNEKYKTGFYAALSGEFFNNKHLSLAADLSYCQKGYQETFLFTTASDPDGSSGVTQTSKDRFDFLAFAPMLRIRQDIGAFSPYLLVGPRIDYYTSYQSKTSYELDDNNVSKPIFGVTAGLGVEYKKNRIGILLEGQYLPDFSHFYESNFLSIHNKAFTAGAGLKYYFGQ